MFLRFEKRYILELKYFFQLRMDFETFNIAGPSGSATTVQTVSNNVVLGTGGVESNFGTACLDDTFAVSNPNGQSPPVICGNNNGMHSKLSNPYSYFLLTKYYFSVCGRQ